VIAALILNVELTLVGWIADILHWRFPLVDVVVTRRIPGGNALLYCYRRGRITEGAMTQHRDHLEECAQGIETSMEIAAIVRAVESGEEIA